MTQDKNYTAATEPLHFEFINILRGVAIFGVVMCHATQVGMKNSGAQAGLPFNLEAYLFAGSHGVALFFVLSAYTLMRSMESRKVHDVASTFSYLVRRFFRIAPAYFTVLLLVFFLIGTPIPGYETPGSDRLSIYELGLHLTFMNGFFPYQVNNFLGVEWSISAEMIFYLLLPAIYFSIQKLNKRAHIIFAASLVYAFCAALYANMYFKLGYFKPIGGMSPNLAVYQAWKYFFVASQLHVFMTGIIVWIALKFWTGKTIHDKKIANLIVACLLILYFGAVYIFTGWDNGLVNFYARFFWAIFAGVTVVLMSQIALKWNSVFSRLGEVSFSLYLVHYPILVLIQKNLVTANMTKNSTINFIVFEAIALPVCCAAAIFLHRFAERPGMALGKWLLQIKRRQIWAA